MLSKNEGFKQFHIEKGMSLMISAKIVLSMKIGSILRTIFKKERSDQLRRQRVECERSRCIPFAR